MRGNGGEPSPDDGGGGGGGVETATDAVVCKTRKREDDGTVYTITGGDCGGSPVPCACCRPSAVGYDPLAGGIGGRPQSRRRPRTWTCGAAGAGFGFGASSLTRSRTFASNYERAISSLLWQPYECRSSSNNSLDDDGDVAVWLDATGRYEPLSSRSSLSLSTIPR